MNTMNAKAISNVNMTKQLKTRETIDMKQPLILKYLADMTIYNVK